MSQCNSANNNIFTLISVTRSKFDENCVQCENKNINELNYVHEFQKELFCMHCELHLNDRNAFHNFYTNVILYVTAQYFDRCDH